MVTDPIHWRRARRFSLALGAILALLGAYATSGWASAGVEQQGAQLLKSLQTGGQKCQQLSPGQFATIGEYVMGRMVGSTANHEAMDQQIRVTTGASGELQAHTFMGQRFTGCATGASPAAFGSMMGMMGNYSGANGMGSGRDGGHGFSGGMMGGAGIHGGGINGWGSTDTMVVILLAALVALAAWRPWRRYPPKTPFDVLSERYARGEIDAADFEQRRNALQSPT